MLMEHYFHHTPGRLRVKNPRFKKNQHLAGEVELLLKSIYGVNSVATNLVTGSIVIRYEPQETKSEDILHTLNRAGYFDLSQAVTNDEIFHDAFRKGGRTIRSIVLGALIKDRLEDSALSLIAALI
jgi:hypothetical protein